jgi:hypothetical protein
MNKIALLNDAFRRTFRGGKVMMTSGVDELPDCVKAEALRQVETFSEFTPDNDPHGEHNFGSFTLVGRKFFWKIEYYDREMTRMLSLTPSLTRRSRKFSMDRKIRRTRRRPHASSPSSSRASTDLPSPEQSRPPLHARIRQAARASLQLTRPSQA